MSVYLDIVLQCWVHIEADVSEKPDICDVKKRVYIGIDPILGKYIGADIGENADVVKKNPDIGDVKRLVYTDIDPISGQYRRF
jgi:hypothetical protein